DSAACRGATYCSGWCDVFSGRFGGEAPILRRGLSQRDRTSPGEVDHGGLRAFIPEDLIPWDELGRLARGTSLRRTIVIWILVDDRNAEAIVTEVTAGRHRAACGLLLNSAVELIPIDSAVPEPARTIQ